jgi:hypothetical protein
MLHCTVRPYRRLIVSKHYLPSEKFKENRGNFSVMHQPEAFPRLYLPAEVRNGCRPTVRGHKAKLQPNGSPLTIGIR